MILLRGKPTILMVGVVRKESALEREEIDIFGMFEK